ncbi:MAG: hypothetical protein WA130_11840 [Candidatus Methanoperedens sp.]
MIIIPLTLDWPCRSKSEKQQFLYSNYGRKYGHINPSFPVREKNNKQRALGMLLYHTGLSYEKAGMFAGASYKAVLEWYKKGKDLFEVSIKKKVRKWRAS